MKQQLRVVVVAFLVVGASLVSIGGQSLGTLTETRNLATLRVKFAKTANGIVTLVLQSGRVIEVLESDLYAPMSAPTTVATSGGVTITDRNSRGPGTRVEPGQSASAPSGQDAMIRAKCEREWPTDFSVRAYCERTQREALAELAARVMATNDQRVIRTKCAQEWPDDFSVRNYCEETQLKALTTLGR